jgi:hypothetical protein
MTTYEDFLEAGVDGDEGLSRRLKEYLPRDSASEMGEFLLGALSGLVEKPKQAASIAVAGFAGGMVLRKAVKTVRAR